MQIACECQSHVSGSCSCKPYVKLKFLLYRVTSDAAHQAVAGNQAAAGGGALSNVAAATHCYCH